MSLPSTGEIAISQIKKEFGGFQAAMSEFSSLDTIELNISSLTGSNFNDTTIGYYFDIFMQTSFRVWFNNGVQTAPSAGGRTLISVSYTNSSTTDQLLNAIITTLQANSINTQKLSSSVYMQISRNIYNIGTMPSGCSMRVIRDNNVVFTSGDPLNSIIITQSNSGYYDYPGYKVQTPLRLISVTSRIATNDWNVSLRILNTPWDMEVRLPYLVEPYATVLDLTSYNFLYYPGEYIQIYFTTYNQNGTFRVQTNNNIVYWIDITYEPINIIPMTISNLTMSNYYSTFKYKYDWYPYNALANSSTMQEINRYSRPINPKVDLRISQLLSQPNASVVSIWNGFTSSVGPAYYTASGYGNIGRVNFTLQKHLSRNGLSFNISTNNGFTAMCLIRFTSTGFGNRIFDFGNGESSDNIIFSRYDNTSALQFQIYNGGILQQVGITTTGVIVNSEWAVFTVRYQNFPRILQFYKNNNLLTIATNGNLGLITDKINLSINYIGRSNWAADTNAYFEGDLAHLIVYDRYLTNMENTSLYGYMTNYMFTAPRVDLRSEYLLASLNNTAVSQWNTFSSNAPSPLPPTYFMTTPGYNNRSRVNFVRGNSNFLIQTDPTITWNIGTNGGFTAIAAVRFTDISLFSYERIFDFGNGSSNGNILLARLGTSGIFFRIHNPSTVTQQFFTSTGTIIQNEWAIFTVRYRSFGTSILELYKNNILLTNIDPVNTTPPIDRTFWGNYIGRSHWASDAYFSGDISYLIAYDRCLNSNEMSNLYNFVSSGLDGSRLSSNTLPSNPKINLQSIQIVLPNNTYVSTWNGFTSSYYNRPTYLTETTTNPARVSFNNNFNQHLSIPSLTLNIATNNGFTAICLVRFSKTSYYERIFDFGNGAGNNNILLCRVENTPHLLFDIFSSSNSILQLGQVNNCIVNGEWAVFSVRYQRSPRILQIYKNNILQRLNGDTNTNPGTDRTSTINYIGRSNWSGDSYLNADIGNILIYDRYLSDAEFFVMGANIWNIQNQDSTAKILTCPTSSTGTNFYYIYYNETNADITATLDTIQFGNASYYLNNSLIFTSYSSNFSNPTQTINLQTGANYFRVYILPNSSGPGSYQMTCRSGGTVLFVSDENTYTDQNVIDYNTWYNFFTIFNQSGPVYTYQTGTDYIPYVQIRLGFNSGNTKNILFSSNRIQDWDAFVLDFDFYFETSSTGDGLFCFIGANDDALVYPAQAGHGVGIHESGGYNSFSLDLQIFNASSSVPTVGSNLINGMNVSGQNTSPSNTVSTLNNLSSIRNDRWHNLSIAYRKSTTNSWIVTMDSSTGVTNQVSTLSWNFPDSAALNTFLTNSGNKFGIGFRDSGATGSVFIRRVRLIRPFGGQLLYSFVNLTGWTIVGTVNLSGGEIQVSSGGYAYRNLANDSVTTLADRTITFDMKTDVLGNFFFCCNSSGWGDMFRLETRAVSTYYSGFARTNSFGSWNPPTTILVNASYDYFTANVWNSIKIQIFRNNTSAVYINGTLRYSNYTIYNCARTFISLNGDGGGGVTSFRNLKIYEGIQ